MSDKFSAVPVEEDTRILLMHLIAICGIDARFELWGWEGVVGESLIFVTAEIVDLSDELLWQNIVNQLSLKDMRHTISRKAGYTFVNFNFGCIDDYFLNELANS